MKKQSARPQSAQNTPQLKLNKTIAQIQITRQIEQGTEILENLNTSPLSLEKFRTLESKESDWCKDNLFLIKRCLENGQTIQDEYSNLVLPTMMMSH